MPAKRVLIPLCAMLLTLAVGGGCVRRTLTVTTDPPGALVFLNGVEAGRTPMERDFVYYGTYDVVLRKEGYETLKAQGKVIAPWWQWVPIDLFAELFPLHDQQTLTYTLYPVGPGATDPQKMLGRAEAMRPELESSPNTRAPSTRATTTTSPTAQ
jgi:hypothetical protein